MDMQTMLDNAMAARRAESMKLSPQLTIGELVLKLESIPDKNNPIFFDNENYFPIALDSWRGSYCEIAFKYADKETETATPLSVQKILNELKEAIGKTYEGYKGGDFLMGKNTPVWIANYGNSCGYNDETMGIVDVKEMSDKVILVTENIKY